MFTRKSQTTDATYEVTKTDEEWKDILPADRYAVLRKAGTEPAWSGELLHVDGEGVFRCAGCGAELFHTDAKVRLGVGLAELRPGPIGRDHRGEVGPGLRHDPDRDPVRSLRRASRARVPRRPDRDRAALLRQLTLADLRPGRGGLRGLTHA